MKTIKVMTKEEFYCRLVYECDLKDNEYEKAKYSIYQAFRGIQKTINPMDLSFEDITAQFQETAIEMRCDIAIAALGVNAIVDWVYSCGSGDEIMKFTKTAIEKTIKQKQQKK